MKTRLTKSELAVMEVLWDEGEALTSAEIIQKSKEKEWKDSSVHLLINSYRSKKLAEQKKKGKRKGRGSVKGAKKARNPKKQEWMTTIRALRKDLKEMRDANEIDATTYRKLYKMAKGGAFRSKSYMKTYARDHDLIK